MAAATGRIRVRFFARYAEFVGRDETALAVTLPTTVGEVVRRVRAELPGADAIPERPLVALNLRHVRADAPLSDGDEVALLPPMAGG